MDFSQLLRKGEKIAYAREETSKHGGFFSALTLVRFVAMVVFGYMAYDYVQNKREGLAVTFGALALLFQPFFKVALGRGMWNVVDVVVAIGLIILIFRNHT